MIPCIFVNDNILTQPKMNKIDIPPSLARLVQLLKSGIEKDGKLSPLKAKELVLEADVQVEDMYQYADFEHPVEDCYGRQMVYDNGNFEVMVMSWNPNDYSSIHNHGYTQWGVVQVFADVHHFIYQVKDNQMSFAKKEVLPNGTAVKVNNALIHQMGNLSSEKYFTLHVYGANDRDEGITADAKNYDLEYERISHTTGGAFFNLPENLIYDYEKCPVPTAEVLLHYYHLLMNYYCRQPQSEKIDELKQNIISQMQEKVSRLSCESAMV